MGGVECLGVTSGARFLPGDTHRSDSAGHQPGIDRRRTETLPRHFFVCGNANADDEECLLQQPCEEAPLSPVARSSTLLNNMGFLWTTVFLSDLVPEGPWLAR
jgi:hypothetical protein